MNSAIDFIRYIPSFLGSVEIGKLNPRLLLNIAKLIWKDKLSDGLVEALEESVKVISEVNPKLTVVEVLKDQGMQTLLNSFLEKSQDSLKCTTNSLAGDMIVRCPACHRVHELRAVAPKLFEQGC